MTVSIQKFIENNYGNKRGAEAAFLRDNQHIGTTDNARKAQLWRWKNKGFLVVLKTGHIYQPNITLNLKCQECEIKPNPCSNTSI